MERRAVPFEQIDHGRPIWWMTCRRGFSIRFLVLITALFWTWDGSQTRSLEIYTKPLKEIERAHPEWKAPKLKFARVEFVDLFTKCVATVY